MTGHLLPIKVKPVNGKDFGQFIKLALAGMPAGVENFLGAAFANSLIKTVKKIPA